MDANTKRFLQTIAQKATEAADDARLAMQSATKAVGEKYDAARLGLEISKLKSEQERNFADIGRLVFYMNTGEYTNGPEDTTPQQAIDCLLLAAEQKQQELDAMQKRQAELLKTVKCPVCKQNCDEEDKFCSKCGAKI